MDWNSSYIEGVVARAIREDAGPADAFVAAAFPGAVRGVARIVTGQDVVVAGLPLAAKVFETFDPATRAEFCAADGDLLRSGQELLRLDGKVAAILTGERTALHLLGRLSSIATLTRAFVDRVQGTGAQIRLSSKAADGFWPLEDYAVRIAGGAGCAETNERILLTETHIAAMGGVTAALGQAQSYAALRSKPRALTAYEAVGSKPAADELNSLPVQIEIHDEVQLQEALEAGTESVRLIGMDAATARHCTVLVRNALADCTVEISADITLQNVREFAETGADFLLIRAPAHTELKTKFKLLVESDREK
jgi:nicotinate-nucleotide pyrophosphorylase (carboxylating)